MRLSLFAALLAIAVPRPVEAQSGQPDNAAILRAIEALSGRIDRLEDKVRQNDQRPTAKMPRGVAQQTSSEKPTKPGKPAGQSVPGWHVGLIPWTDAGDSEEIASFAGPMFDYNFDLHSRYMSGNDRYIYHGKSIIHIKEDGNYLFVFVLEPVSAQSPTVHFATTLFNCSAQMNISKNKVLSGKTNFVSLQGSGKDVFRSQNISGSLRLEPGKYPAEFWVDCWAERNEKSAVYENNLLANWKKNRFKIHVKGPGDTLPRPFQPDELYYIGLR